MARSGIAGIAGAVSFLAGHGEADPGHVAELQEVIARHVLEPEEEIVALSGDLTALSYLDLVSPPATAPAPGFLAGGGRA